MDECHLKTKDLEYTVVHLSMTLSKTALDLIQMSMFLGQFTVL